MYEANNEDMERYIKEKIVNRNLSFSIQNQVVSACKLFFSEIVHSPLNVNKLERPRREYRLPNVLSKEEITAILKAPKNIKIKNPAFEFIKRKYIKFIVSELGVLSYNDFLKKVGKI